MNMLDKAYDRASCEIDELLQHQTFDKSDVELLGEFIDIVKDIEMIYGYQNDMADLRGSYNNGGSYAYGRSGRTTPMISSMPMYMRGSYAKNGNMNNGYSRDENKEAMLSHLQNVADMAIDEKDRKAVERLMTQMREN